MGGKDYYNDIQNCKFNWRWMLKNEVFYRAVTIERVENFTPKDPTPAIFPGRLHSITPEFYDAGQVLFGWRWFLTKNAGDRGLVTLEDTDMEIPA